MTAVQHPQPRTYARSADDRLLLGAAALFTVAVVLHGADHARRGASSVDLDVFWVGTSAIAVELGVVVLAAQRHRLAALAAVSAGLSLALGYVVVHFLPERSWLSDSLTDTDDVSRLSWTAASLEVVAALVLGLAGLVVLRRRGGLASAQRTYSEPLAPRRAWTHPVVVVMALGNAAILAVSLAQLATG